MLASALCELEIRDPTISRRPRRDPGCAEAVTINPGSLAHIVVGKRADGNIKLPEMSGWLKAQVIGLSLQGILARPTHDIAKGTKRESTNT